MCVEIVYDIYYNYIHTISKGANNVSKKYIKIIAISTFLLVSVILLLNMYLSLNESELSFRPQPLTNTKHITIYAHDLSDKQNIISEVISQYQAKNNVEISFKSHSALDFYTKLHIDFSTGNPPDIIVAPFDTSIQHLFKSGKLASLNKLFENNPDWKTSIDNNALQSVTIENNIIGIPTNYNFITLYVNLTLFKKAGISPPQNYSELCYAIQKLNSIGITPIAFGLQEENMFLYQTIVSSLGGNTGVSMPYQYNQLNSNCYIDALKYMQDLYDMKAFPADCLSLCRDDVRNIFINNSAAMIAEDSSFISYLANSCAKVDCDNYDIISFPTFTTQSTSYFDNQKYFSSAVPYFTGENTYYISTTAYQNKYDDIIPLLKELTSLETAQQLYDKFNQQSTIKNINPRINRSSIETKGSTLPYKLIGYSDAPVNKIDSYLWYSTLFEAMPSIFQRNHSPETLWNTLNDFSIKIQKRAKK